MRFLPSQFAPRTPASRMPASLPSVVFMTANPIAMAFGMAILLTCCSVATAEETVTQEVSFQEDVRPILSNHCFACHGPDENHNAAGFRLDVEGEADLDEVLVRIGSEDPESIMPPPDMHKPLNPEQIAILKQWIEQGAPYEAHWSFVAPTPPALPELVDADWTSPIDRFVRSKMESKGLTPRPRADRRTLIRRLSLDLTGLPPTADEIKAFLNDDSKTAYQDLVDRLIAKPAFGEHMARYWLDLVRFADTNGMHHDHYREMTPYRDWVIRSFNENLPFDQFMVDQIAGDLHPDPSVDQLIASGFNRLHLIIDRGTALPEESFMKNVVDRVSAVGTAFMGLTLQCAVCHDHKYDPISQKDFYSLYAFFNNFDGGPETGGRRGTDFQRGLQPPFIEFPSDEQAQTLTRLNDEIARLQSEAKALQPKPEPPPQAAPAAEKVTSDKNAEPSSSVTTSDASKLHPPSGRVERSEGRAEPEMSPEERKQKRQQVQAAIAKLNQERDSVLVNVPATLVMKERAEIRPAHILIRGAYDAPGEVVPRDTPSFLPPMPTKDDPNATQTRMDLARWMVDPSNPLTARVAVNRFWQQLFGVGLVKTSEDFGAQGQPPSHPKLLDHLAIDFVETGWNVQALMRSIVHTKAYQQSSIAPSDAYESDPQNRWLARGSRYRLDAEVIRDQVLSVCGLLSPTMYGKSVKPPQPEGLWKIVAMPTSYPNSYVPDSGENTVRRSVYTFWKRGLPPPQMTIFDAPNRDSCIARRERTNTPLQALLMMNEPQFFSATTAFAQRLLDKETWNADDSENQKRLAAAYEAITSRPPTDAALESLSQSLDTFQALYESQPAEATALVQRCTAPTVQSVTSVPDQIRLAAWTMVVHSILNLDCVRTRE
ncbi:PSD1 and planctomycete cytochrome C domain-containing protein [Rhodopirellula sp. P2]|uniref:PSD1 and planctomycete cytochrome C domain-containing protein n=1 Tax=Rhodopirellula sp. P2 TaxID=2127060 RepID=UPI0023684116|nr:PSD1 and planctomycete cytochrome C domain-containing protein [Rhodopirellula sp. P2]WDQ16829.1 PSD1 and planctomycete cytochrome C domain-containing protein [Rhodopirellula sp. P2]